MTNLLRGEVSLPISDDQVLNLVFDFNTLCLVEEELDQSIVDVFSGLKGTPRLKLVRALLWAGAQEKHPEITPAGAGGLIVRVGLPVVAQAVTKGLMAAMPAPVQGGEAAEGDEGPPQGGTGPNT